MSDFKGIEVSDVLGLSEPLKKLVEVVSGAIGTWYEPIHTKRMAKAKAKEVEVLSSAVNENINLPLKYDDGKVLIDSTSAKKLIEKTKNRLIFQEINKQQNIDSVVHNAYENLKKEKNVSEEPVDKDWVLRFFNSIEDISNEEMQKIWGKILAGEIKQPITFSLRTLETLKNLSQHDAQLFTKISAFKIKIDDTYCIPANSELCQKFNISYGDILILEECRLVNSRPLNLSVEPLPGHKECLINTDTLICSFKSLEKINKKINIRCYKITEEGIQLLKVIEKKHNEEYVKCFFRELKKQSSCYSVSVHKIKNISDSGVAFENEDLIIDG